MATRRHLTPFQKTEIAPYGSFALTGPRPTATQYFVVTHETADSVSFVAVVVARAGTAVASVAAKTTSTLIMIFRTMSPYAAMYA